MKDIDFDEIDKAVNSAMGSKKADNSAPQQSIANSLQVDDSTVTAAPVATDAPDPQADLKVGEDAVSTDDLQAMQDSLDTLTVNGDQSATPKAANEENETMPQNTQAESSVTNPDSTPTSPSNEVVTTDEQVTPSTEEQVVVNQAVPVVVQQQKRGRFMDVMHPSSDMGTTSEEASATTNNEQQQSIAPSESSTVEDVALESTDSAAEPDDKNSANVAETQARNAAVDAPGASPSGFQDDDTPHIGVLPGAEQDKDDEERKAIFDQLMQTQPAEEHKAPEESAQADDEGAISEVSLSESSAESTKVSQEKELESKEDTSTHEEDTPSSVDETADDKTSAVQHEPAPAAVPVKSSVVSTQETPFISDAKIEKRPLGNSSANGDHKVTHHANTEPSSLLNSVTASASKGSDIHDDSNHPDHQALLTAGGSDAAVAHPVFGGEHHGPTGSGAKKSKGNAWAWWLLGVGACLIVGSGVGYLLFSMGI